MADTAAPSKLSEAKRQKLRDAMRWSRKQLEPFRRIRYQLISELVGKHYGENEDDREKDRKPVNQLGQAVSIYQRSLVANAPRYIVTPSKKELKLRATTIENKLNLLVQELGLKSVFRNVALEALLGIGVVKCGLEDQSAEEHEQLGSGEPYCDFISLDDLIVDLKAKSWNNVAYIGNIYCMPLEVAQENELFKKGVREKLVKSEYHPIDNDANGADKAEALSKGTASSDDGDFLDYVDLADIYLPYQNMLVTLAWDQEDLEPLYEAEWLGPLSPTGPYRVLSFEDVPDNLMPSAPATQWKDLDALINILVNKCARQAERQKTQTWYTPAAVADAQRMVESDDGETNMTENPGGVTQTKSGGVDQGNFAFTLQLLQLFNRAAGNLDVLGGLASTADTLGQEELMSTSANKVVSEMQDRMADFAAQIGRDLGWYLWTDPVKVYSMSVGIPGTRQSIGVNLHPQGTPQGRDGTQWHVARDGDFYEMNLTISPYSMRHESPASKMKAIMDYLNVTAQFAQQIQAQGNTIDWQYFTELYADYNNLPELEELVILANPTDQGPQQGEAPIKPPMTTRNYNRRSSGSVNQQGQQQAMISQLMGAKLQPKEQGMAGRVA